MKHLVFFYIALSIFVGTSLAGYSVENASAMKSAFVQTVNRIATVNQHKIDSNNKLIRKIYWLIRVNNYLSTKTSIQLSLIAIVSLCFICLLIC